MAKGLDVGTMFLVKAEEDELVDGTGFTVERNVFLQAATTDDTEETLKENHWAYAKHDDEYYILGEDALKLKNLLTVGSKRESDNIVMTKVGDLRRPMQNGILNTSEEKLSIAIIQKIIANLVGKPSQPNEVLCYCAPGDPVDSNLSVVFHKGILTKFLSSLGYHVECVPEALAIIFSECPTVEDDAVDGGEAPFSGISFSFGAGMCNICFAYKKLPLIAFSVARSGDWIDREASKVAGVDQAAMTRYKESHFDLNNVDYSNMKDAALDIFYSNMIEHALSNFSEKFNQLDRDSQTTAPLEIVVAGGTASIPGFLEKFKEVLSEKELPFNVKNVKMAAEPLYTVASGCLAKAISVENKKAKVEEPPAKPKKDK